MSASQYNPYNWKFLLFTQVWLIIISIVLTYYPQYYFEVIILYIIVIFGFTFFMTYKSNPVFRDRKLLYEIVNSRTIYEEKDVTKLIMADQEYQKQYMDSIKRNFRMLGFYIVYLAILFFAYQYIIKFADSQTLTYRLLVYLAYFEALFGIGFFVSRKILAPSISNMAPMALPSYKITEKGIVSGKGYSVFLHAKYLLNSEITINREKHYIEIDSTKQKLPYKVRLYSQDIDKVLDYIERVKRLELKRQSSEG